MFREMLTICRVSHVCKLFGRWNLCQGEGGRRQEIGIGTVVDGQEL